MTFTFNPSPSSDRDKLRVIIGDITLEDGPAPNRANLADDLLDYFLDSGGSIAGAAAEAFDHLASLWVTRPIFGPGELSTVHTNVAAQFRKLADEWRQRAGGTGDLSATAGVSSFTKSDGYAEDASEYTA